jgi:hypothetical protein
MWAAAWLIASVNLASIPGLSRIRQRSVKISGAEYRCCQLVPGVSIIIRSPKFVLRVLFLALHPADFEILL